MPKNLYVDPNVVRAPGKVTFNDIPVNQYNKTIKEELDSGKYGQILRAKGIVNGEGGWIEFDYVPEEHEIRAGHADYTGRLCVIGANLNEAKLAELFGL